MIIKYNYNVDAKGVVTRTKDYSFVPVDGLSSRLEGVSSVRVIQGVANRTLKGEAELPLIQIEDSWFKVQSNIQDMDAERTTLENKLARGDSNGNPLNPTQQNVISARIAELKEGTIVTKKEFYNHYTRETSVVDDVAQTAYTIALETRADLESVNPYLAGLRGVAGAPARPTSSIDAETETSIRKELVRHKIAVQVGDMPDLLADVSNALAALIKKVNGASITAEEQTDIDQYVSRQAEVAAILKADYNK